MHWRDTKNVLEYLKSFCKADIKLSILLKSAIYTTQLIQTWRLYTFQLIDDICSIFFGIFLQIFVIILCNCKFQKNVIPALVRKD